MNHESPLTPPRPAAMPNPAAPRKPRLNWFLIIGLAALSLLWPLSSVLGFDGAPRAALVIALTLATWIGVVGLCRVPRAVLTLTLTGIVYGALYLTSMAILVTPLIFFAWYTVAATAGLGALAGLGASGVQKMIVR